MQSTRIFLEACKALRKSQIVLFPQKVEVYNLFTKVHQSGVF